MRRLAVLLPVLLALTLVVPSATAQDESLAPKLRASLVMIHTTSQGYDTTSPWKMGRESTRGGRGVVVKPNLILTPAVNVVNQRMIEVSIVNSARRYPAKLHHVDHRMGLALVEIVDEDLRSRMAPLPLGDPIKLDDELEIHQLGRDNMLERFDARVVRASAYSTTLSLTVKTNCSDRGDGQVAIKDGKVVGLVTGTFGSRQEGTLLALETLRHYLDDFDDDKYNGCPGPGPWVQPLLRKDLRTYFGVSEGQHGIGVTRVSPGRTGDGVLKDGDVILALDGYDLDDEGMFNHAIHGRLDFGYLFQGRRYVGDRIRAKVLRAGEVIGVELELLGQKPGEKQVPEGVLEDRPQFLVVGGLVILELTGRSPISRSSGGVLLRRFRDRVDWDPPSDRKRIVYVDRVMADKSNKGQDSLMHAPIVTVNGMKINELKDVATALESPKGKFHVFRFEGVTPDFVIPVEERETIDKRITDTYKITMTRNIRGMDSE